MRSQFRLVFGQFFILSWSEKGHEPSWKSEILQLEIWLEPAWLGLITSIYTDAKNSLEMPTEKKNREIGSRTEIVR